MEDEQTKKGDFVEIEFLGRDLSNNEIFDTNIKEEAKKLNPKEEPKPLVVCIGENMVVKGFDNSLAGKEIGKKFKIKIQPEEAFGKRDSKLVRLIPKRVFLEHQMNPIAGMTVALDNSLARIVSVSGGRVLVDLNNPLAGKEVEFEIAIKNKISDTKEKINALQDFFFGRRFDFDIDENSKKIIFKELQLAAILNIFKEKFKNILGFEVEIFAKPEKKEEKLKLEENAAALGKEEKK